MRWCLTGKAADYYSNLLDRQQDLPYHQVESNLAKRYGRKDGWLNIRQRAKKDSEYLDDWADRIVDLTYRAFPDPTEAIVEHHQVVSGLQ